MELPNIVALTERLPEIYATNSELLVRVAGAIEQLLAPLNRSSALAKIVRVREEATESEFWSGERWFESERLLIESLLDVGQIQPAYEKAQALLEKAKAASYKGADNDLAMAHLLLGRILRYGGQTAPALDLFIASQQFFRNLVENRERT